MYVRTEQTIIVPAAIEAVFDHACEGAKLAALLTGWGPVPATTSIELLDGASTPAVGVKRRVHTSDGAALEEEVLVFDRPRRHTYRLYGNFRGLAKLLVREGQGDWSFESLGPKSTRVVWRYQFELRSPLWWPAGLAMIRIAFAGMMRTGLRNLAAVFGG